MNRKIMVIYDQGSLEHYRELQDYVARKKMDITLFNGKVYSNDEYFQAADAVVTLGDPELFYHRAYFNLDRPNLLKYKGKKPLFLIQARETDWEKHKIWNLRSLTNPAVCLNDLIALNTMSEERRKIVWDDLFYLLDECTK